ncbi:hypothetical protein MNEG_4169, partial [Monoraphidium neglectum]
VMTLPVADFKLLLAERNLPLLGGGKGADPKQQQQQQPKQALSAAALSALESIASGGAVARLAPADAAALGLAGGAAGGEDDDGGALAASAPPAVCVWRTRASLSVLVTKAESDDMLEKIVAGEGKHKAAKPQVAAAAGGGERAQNAPAVAAL